MTDTVPSGLAILMGDNIFLTIKEWDAGASDPEGTGGIGKFEDAFDTAEKRSGFDDTVEATTGFKREEILGNVVVPGSDSISRAVAHPGTCAFRVESGGSFFVARALLQVGRTDNQEFSVIALMDVDAALKQKFQDAWSRRDGDPGASPEVTLQDLMGAEPRSVLSSITITRDQISSNDPLGHSEDFGDGRP